MDRPNRLQSSKSVTGASGTLQDDGGEKDFEQYLIRGFIRLSNHLSHSSLWGEGILCKESASFLVKTDKWLEKCNGRVAGHGENASLVR